MYMYIRAQAAAAVGGPLGPQLLFDRHLTMSLSAVALLSSWKQQQQWTAATCKFLRLQRLQHSFIDHTPATSQQTCTCSNQLAKGGIVYEEEQIAGNWHYCEWGISGDTVHDANGAEQWEAYIPALNIFIAQTQVITWHLLSLQIIINLLTNLLTYYYWVQVCQAPW